MREYILNGVLPLPSSHKFAEALSIDHFILTEQMFKSLWHNYLKNKGSTSLTYWADKFNNAKVFNTVLIALSEASWIVSHAIPARNWAEAHINEDKLLEFVSQTELEQVRAYNKYRKYVLTDNPSKLSKATRIKGKVQDTGLVRQGFMKAGNSRFRYDTGLMEKYAYTIQLNLTKSMDKIAEYYPELRHDLASYDTVSTEILEYYMDGGEYTRGDNYIDSRGRAISDSLSKVGNPISCKDFRALLVMPN